MNTRLTQRNIRLLRAQFSKVDDKDTFVWLGHHIAIIMCLQNRGEIAEADPVDVLLDYWQAQGTEPTITGASL